MQIRQDLCTPENQKHLQALINRTQEALPKTFPTPDSVIQYVNNFRDPQTALLFLNVGNYYNAATLYTCPNCQPPTQTQSCSICNITLQPPPFNTLIMFFSVMEKLAAVESSGVEGWVDFYDWVSRKDVDAEYKQVLRKGLFRDFGALMDSLKGKWSKEFGGLVKVTNFLRGAMRSEEKLALVCSIRYMQQAEAPSGDSADKTCDAAVPACFDSRKPEKCFSEQGYCTDKTHCAVLADEAKLDKCFKDTIKTIYEWRSRYIYDAQLPPLHETALYGVQYRGKNATAEVSVTELKPVFEALIKRFFDKYQVTQSKSKHKKH